MIDWEFSTIRPRVDHRPGIHKHLERVKVAAVAAVGAAHFANIEVAFPCGDM